MSKLNLKKYLPQIVVGVISGLVVLIGDKLYDRYTEVPLPLVYPLHFDGHLSKDETGYALITKLDNFTGNSMRVDEIVLTAYDGTGRLIKSVQLHASPKPLPEKKYMIFEASFASDLLPEAFVFCSKYFAGGEARDSRDEFVVNKNGGDYHVTPATRERLNLIKKLASC